MEKKYYVNIYKLEDVNGGTAVKSTLQRTVKAFTEKTLADEFSDEVEQHLSLAADVVSGEYRGGHTATICQDDVGQLERDYVLAVANTWLPGGRWAEESYVTEVEEQAKKS